MDFFTEVRLFFMKRLWLLVPLWAREEKLHFWIKVQKFTWKKCRIFSYMVHNYIYYHFGCDISPKANIASTVTFPHPIGIVIGDGVEIQDNVTIYQNVTLGKKEKKGIIGYPTVEIGTIIYPSSCIFGDIVLKENTVIGAGSIITKSTEVGCTYCGIPAKKLR